MAEYHKHHANNYDVRASGVSNYEIARSGQRNYRADAVITHEYRWRVKENGTYISL